MRRPLLVGADNKYRLSRLFYNVFSLHEGRQREIFFMTKTNDDLYSVVKWTLGANISCEEDQYAFMYAGNYGKIFGDRQCNNHKRDNTGYLKVSHNGHSIYLRYKSWNGIKSNEIMLSYPNAAAIDAVPKQNITPEVKIKKSCWFQYCWHNRDTATRRQFQWAFWGFLALLGMEIPQFVVRLISLFDKTN